MIIAALPFRHMSRVEPGMEEWPRIRKLLSKINSSEESLIKAQDVPSPPVRTCIGVGGLIFRLELIYVVQVLTRCSCDVSSIPVGVQINKEINNVD